MGLLDNNFIQAALGGLEMGMRSNYEDIKEESALQRQVELYKQKLGLESAQKLADEETMHARGEQRKADRLAKIQGIAKGMGAEDMANLDKAKQIYRDWGGEGSDLGVAAADYQQGLLTNKNLASAAAQHDGNFDKLHQYGREATQDARQEQQDAYAKEKDARDFKLREQETKARLGQLAQAAADRADAKADKQALKAEYELLGHYLTSKSTNPSGDYSKEIAASVSKIASLGGDPTAMINLLFGKETTEKVAVKTGDASMGQPEETRTRDVKGPRQGGVLSGAVDPNTSASATLPGLIKTAKDRGYAPDQIKATLKKNGFTEEQLKAAGL